MIDGWDLIEQQDYAEAIYQFENEYRTTESICSLNNLGLAYLFSEQPLKAKDIFKESVKIDKYSDEGSILLGIANWLLDDYINAIAAWKSGLKAEYRDAAGGIEIPLLIYFAGIVQPNIIDKATAERLLKKRLSLCRTNLWPSPIASYLLNEISEANLKSKACFGFPILPRIGFPLFFFVPSVRYITRQQQAHSRFLYWYPGL